MVTGTLYRFAIFSTIKDLRKVKGIGYRSLPASPDGSGHGANSSLAE
jgi:hypothetical protein